MFDWILEIWTKETKGLSFSVDMFKEDLIIRKSNIRILENEEKKTLTFIGILNYIKIIANRFVLQLNEIINSYILGKVLQTFLISLLCHQLT